MKTKIAMMHSAGVNEYEEIAFGWTGMIMNFWRSSMAFGKDWQMGCMKNMILGGLRAF